MTETKRDVSHDTYDSSGRVEVVEESRDGRNTRDGALGQVDWAEADDTIDTREASGLGGGTERLRGDSEATVGDLECRCEKGVYALEGKGSNVQLRSSQFQKRNPSRRTRRRCGQCWCHQKPWCRRQPRKSRLTSVHRIRERTELKAHPKVGRTGVNDEVESLGANLNSSDVGNILVDGRAGAGALLNTAVLGVVVGDAGLVALDDGLGRDGLATGALADGESGALLVGCGGSSNEGGDRGSDGELGDADHDSRLVVDGKRGAGELGWAERAPLYRR